MIISSATIPPPHPQALDICSLGYLASSQVSWMDKLLLSSLTARGEFKIPEDVSLCPQIGDDILERQQLIN